MAPAKLLMTLPGMTESIADAILDWIDPDDDSRIIGAERDYYSALDPAYDPRNGPLGSIEELLLVRDVTPALLFGADLNRNGDRSTATKSPSRRSKTSTTQTALLNRGWAAYFTLDSAEEQRPSRRHAEDRRQHGRPRRASQAAHSKCSMPRKANFIVAYRQGGAYTEQEVGQTGRGR